MLTPGELTIGQLVAVHEWKEPAEFGEPGPFGFPRPPTYPIPAGYPGRIKAVALPFIQIETDRGVALVDTRECAIMEVPARYASGFLPAKKGKK